jgi:NAD-dependent dihydropyrimidine dehydrogenase PreA subunit
MEAQTSYEKLAKHLSRLGMGYPQTETLVELLEENFSEIEAEVALAIPTGVIPLSPVRLDDILKTVDLSRKKLSEILDDMVGKGLLFSGPLESGEKGYALQQVGFGFPQAFFWKGEDTPRTREMAGKITKYFNRQVTAAAYSGQTKPFRYIPVDQSLTPELQAVYPLHMMEQVIEKAGRIALAHCPCRVSYKLLGKECSHPEEVCMKFDEMADYLIDRGIGRSISKEEAQEVIRKSDEAGLVHFVDNTENGIKHNCNCCGCACWNVGNIRRRKIPRDVIMAAYFIRTTDEDQCAQCGACVDICPVDALRMEEGPPLVDHEWCIGCGVCATVCPTGSVRLELRPDKGAELPEADWTRLHKRILKEKFPGQEGE